MDVIDAQAPFDPREFDVVLATSLRDTERTAPGRLLLTFAPTAEAAVREAAARASTGASTGVEVRVEDGQLLAEVSVPDDQAELLDLLALRAETAGHRVLQQHRAATAA